MPGRDAAASPQIRSARLPRFACAAGSVDACGHAIRKNLCLVEERFQHRRTGAGDGRVPRRIRGMQRAALRIGLRQQVVAVRREYSLERGGVRQIRVDRIFQTASHRLLHPAPKFLGARSAMHQPFLEPRGQQLRFARRAQQAADMRRSKRGKVVRYLRGLVRVGRIQIRIGVKNGIGALVEQDQGSVVVVSNSPVPAARKTERCKVRRGRP